jgi:hypothetical protein
MKGIEDVRENRLPDPGISFAPQNILVVIFQPVLKLS